MLRLECIVPLERSDGPAVAMAFLEVSLYARNLRGADRIARLLTAPSRPPRVRSYGHVALAHLALARGKWSEAKKALETIASWGPLDLARVPGAVLLPSNVIVTRDGVVKILDFGVATLAGASRITQTGEAISS